MYKVTINKTDKNAEERLAKITAQYVREGVCFEVVERGDDYVIELTGGY